MAAGFKSFSSEDGGPDDGSGGFKSSSSEDGGPDNGSGGFPISSSTMAQLNLFDSMVWNDLKC